jgi:ribosomal protein L37AE/L43A
VPLRLKCPFCDKPSTFNADTVSICSSCDLEILSADPSERAPRIKCGKTRPRVVLLLLVFGIAFLFLFPPYGAVVGLGFFVAMLAIAQTLADRCGNCGAEIEKRASFCRVCRSDFDGTVL